MIWLLLIFGLILLVAGGELLVRGAVAVARQYRVSPLLIGLTLVGFGTSTPELVTSLQATLDGSPGIAVGNVVGSNIANILLILGITAIITPLAVDPRTFRRDIVVLLLATFALIGASFLGQITALTGAIFIALLAGYIRFAYRQESAAPITAPATLAKTVDRAQSAPLWRHIALVIIGIGLTIFGAKFLVKGAIELATIMGISETIIGLTVVAVGTSLPELVTSVIAAVKKQSDLAFGNIIGSNIFNIFFILGAVSLVQPINIPADIMAVDIWVMLGAALALTVFAVTRWTITRIEGAVMVTAYGAYIGWLAISAGA
ncbi:calcium/sodium antiporter [Robiginitomaculum antarcticum]|uniref:calcium/sodium antiporter n=1 Tax=Robiginitomaculum antarcticum TaxID=437507 RepID=UPI00035CA05C|nr:calcium/sodium antiporter [Robiginitomaculum antarcticum]